MQAWAATSRTRALGINAAVRDRWAKERGLRPSTIGRPCIHNLLRKHVNTLFGALCEECTDEQLWDHPSLWNRDGKPVMLMYHPYASLGQVLERVPSWTALDLVVTIGVEEDMWRKGLPIRFERGRG